MSLLAEIIDQATRSETPLTDLLRRCKILAYRLGYEPLASWVDKELDGYESGDELPAYRNMETSVAGKFSGFAIGGWVTQEAHIGKANLPPEMAEHADLLFSHKSVQGVAAIEDAYRSGEPMLSVPWTPEAARAMTNRVLTDFQCEGAWRQIPRSALAELLDTIRNRVLSFALAIEQASPDAGDVPPGSPPALPREQVAEIARITIYGGHNVFSVGPYGSAQAINVAVNDWASLRDALAGLGFQEDDLDALPEVLKSDEESGAPQLGPATRGWIARAAKRIKSGIGAVTPEVVGGTAAGLILKYLGLG